MRHLRHRAAELSSEEKLAPFRAYLRRGWSLVKGLADLDSPDVTDEQVRKVAASHPVFRLTEINQTATKAK